VKTLKGYTGNQFEILGKEFALGGFKRGEDEKIR
jgi:hypothetical protein